MLEAAPELPKALQKRKWPAGVEFLPKAPTKVFAVSYNTVQTNLAFELSHFSSIPTFVLILASRAFFWYLGWAHRIRVAPARVIADRQTETHTRTVPFPFTRFHSDSTVRYIRSSNLYQTVPRHFESFEDTLVIKVFPSRVQLEKGKGAGTETTHTL